MNSKKTTPIKKVSVIVVVGPGNHEKLHECIESILCSDYRHFEIIIVNNDESVPTRVVKFKKIKRVSVITMGYNSGVDAYNSGIRNGSGEYYFFLDEDCLIEKNTISRLVSTINHSHENIGIVAANVYDENAKSYQHTIAYLESGQLTTFPGGASLIHSNVFDTVGDFDSNFFLWLHEDDLALRALNAGFVIRSNIHAIVHHYDKESAYRPIHAFLVFRNKSWLNIKHFSLILIPLFMLRDIYWMISFAWYKKTIYAFIESLKGYYSGFLTLNTPYSKRQPLSFWLQLRFLSVYFSGFR